MIMPTEVIWKGDHYILKYSGLVKVQESVRAYGQLVGSPNFDSVRFGIVDCREMTEVDYKSQDYDMHAAMAKSASKIREELRVALVIPTPELEEAVRPFLQSATGKFQHQWERRIFRDYDEAVAWASGN